MPDIQVLLPFGLPPAEFAPDLLRALKAPALATLLARAKMLPARECDPFARALPHEAWLAEKFGTAVTDNSPASAAGRMQALQLQPKNGHWFVLQPIHIHIARDHLVLTDRRRTAITETESRALFETAQPLFRQAGKDVLYGDAGTWFLRADDWRGLQTATPDAACGHNIDIWMPQGAGEREWRKLQNEVQMEWHEHAVNAERATRRLPPVNSLWLWGGSDAEATVSTDIPAYANAHVNLTALLDAAPDTELLLIDLLTEAALAEDWGSWLTAMETADANWFAPLLGAMQGGRLSRVTLIVGHGTQLRGFVANKLSLLKFWRQPSLKRLLP